MKTKKVIKIILTTSLLVFILNAFLGNLDAAIKNLPYYLVYSIVFSLGNWFYFMAIGKLLNWEKEPEKTLIISILGVIPVNVFIYFILNYFFRVIISGEAFDRFIAHINPLEYTIVVLFALVISLFIIIGYFFKAVREAKLKAEQLKTEIARTKFESLKNQLDPHFLFNNLNVLTALIGENPDKAESFTLSLSGIYEYVLAQKDKALVPLQEEIDFARKYLNLLKMRYEDDLQFSLPENIPQEAKIPPLSLQILLENAVKHNKILKDNPLVINIKLENDRLIIQNNKKIKKTKHQNGFGLQNLIKRYRLLNSQEIQIDDDKNFFTVSLPIL